MRTGAGDLSDSIRFSPNLFAVKSYHLKYLFTLITNYLHSNKMKKFYLLLLAVLFAFASG